MLIKNKLKHKNNRLTPPPGVLVECEPAIKSILVLIDSENRNEFIIEDLDETHLFVKETMLQLLKSKLEEVSPFSPPLQDSLLIELFTRLTLAQRLKETYRPEEPLEDSE